MPVPREKCISFAAIILINTVLLILAIIYIRNRPDPISAPQPHPAAQRTRIPTCSVSSHAAKHPNLHDLTLTANVPKHYLPTPTNNRRLLVIGDIHGMKTDLDRLLQLADFDAAHDHIVTLGDMVNKGPDSRGVLSRLMALNASAVRGNHEDRLLAAWSKYTGKGASTEQDEVVDQRSRSRKNKKILHVAKSLTREQIEWLANLPVILKATPLRLYFVHGGLVPGVKLEKQDPWAVMNMRTLAYSREELKRSTDCADPESESESDSEGAENDLPAQRQVVGVPIDDHSGERWTKAWDRYQQRHVSKGQRRTVMYGHDAKRGFTEGKYTVGLDSGCAAGGHLTGLIVKAKLGKGFVYDKIQVSCKAAR